MLVIQNGQIVAAVNKECLTYEERKFFNHSEPSKDFYQDNDLLGYSQKHSIVKVNNSPAILAFLHEDDLLEGSSRYQEAINHGANLIFVAGSRPNHALSTKIRQNILAGLSYRDKVAIIYTAASSFESSTNHAYSGEKYIYEAGNLLALSPAYEDGMILSEINLDEIKGKPASLFEIKEGLNPAINFKSFNDKLSRKLSKSPLIPDKPYLFEQKARDVLNISSSALNRRLAQIGQPKIYLGLSGGLDSTMALIVSVYAFSRTNRDLKDIHAIIMPGLGTTERTKTNAHKLASAYGVSIQEIDISKSIYQHFEDISHDKNDHSVVFENAQARERTQILMDLANKHNGIVVGTGNMSEIALGFSTFNADHISMYNPNAGIVKTLLTAIVGYVRDQTPEESIKEVLTDILNTPISPELLPTKEGELQQKTEEIVGPYELHDFFIYHFIRNKSKLKDILFMAEQAFAGSYSTAQIEEVLKIFLRRFSSQQFKRSTMADGPAIEDFSLNPRDGLIMASDIDILNLNL